MTMHGKLRSISAFFFVMVFSCAFSGLCESQVSQEDINVVLANLNDLWESGKISEYHDLVSDAIATMIPVRDAAEDHKRMFAALLLENMLSRNVWESGYGLEYLDLMQRLATHVTSALDLPKPVLKNNAYVIAEYLGYIRGNIIPDYEWQRVTSNVSPPAGNTYRFAGMDPAQIEDQHEREIYEEAIRENSMRNLMNQRQRNLLMANSRMTKRIIEYFGILVNNGVLENEDIEICSLKAGLLAGEHEFVRQSMP